MNSSDVGKIAKCQHCGKEKQIHYEGMKQDKFISKLLLRITLLPVTNAWMKLGWVMNTVPTISTVNLAGGNTTM